MVSRFSRKAALALAPFLEFLRRVRAVTDAGGLGGSARPLPAVQTSVLFDSQSPRRAQSARQHFLTRCAQPDMRHARLPPSAGNRQEYIGHLIDKLSLEFRVSFRFP